MALWPAGQTPSLQAAGIIVARSVRPHNATVYWGKMRKLVPMLLVTGLLAPVLVGFPLYAASAFLIWSARKLFKGGDSGTVSFA